jgi:hypothetical protein
MSREWDLDRRTEPGRSIGWGGGRTMRATRSHLGDTLTTPRDAIAPVEVSC